MSLLEQFAVTHLGRVEVLAAPQSRAAVSTLHVRDDAGQDWFVKQAPSARSWSTEAAAYAVWSRHPKVPRLRAVAEAERLLLVKGCPGSRPVVFRPRVMRAAGRTLRGLHSAPAPPGWPSLWREDLVRRASTSLARVQEHGVDAATAAAVMSLVEEAAASRLPDVPTHGDYLPRNWRWSVDEGLHTFDFGEAALRPAAFDLSRTHHWFLDRPRALAHFMRGYGRVLDEEEERFVRALLPWRAVVSIDVGTQGGLPKLVRRGRAALEQTLPLSVG